MSPIASKKLTAERALIFRIVHRNNIPWILNNGIHSRNSVISDPNYITIGNVDIIEKRDKKVVSIIPGGLLSDYVPFYFTPFSPMLLNIKTGRGGVIQRPNEEIVILVSSLPRCRQLGLSYVFSDRHAYLEPARFYSDDA
jgi:ssDNA thymidine ADP-ribosyltransferase, DarT